MKNRKHTTREIKPVGTLSIDLFRACRVWRPNAEPTAEMINVADRLYADGCELVLPNKMFFPLYMLSYGNPCDGCAYFKDGGCPAYKKHHEGARRKAAETEASTLAEHKRVYTDQSGLIGGKWVGMTIRKIAEQEGISLGEARRRKTDGAYKQ